MRVDRWVRTETVVRGPDWGLRVYPEGESKYPLEKLLVVCVETVEGFLEDEGGPSTRGSTRHSATEIL